MSRVKTSLPDLISGKLGKLYKWKVQNLYFPSTCISNIYSLNRNNRKGMIFLDDDNINDYGTGTNNIDYGDEDDLFGDDLYENAGNWTKWEYDDPNNPDNLTYVEYDDGFWKKYEHDNQGNLTYVMESNGNWCRYEWDNNGNQTRLQEGNGEEIYIDKKTEEKKDTKERGSRVW